MIYGWDIPKENRKPSPWCINDLADKFGVNPEEILVVDDLKPGYDMARSAGARFAAVGWAHHVKTINDFMLLINREAPTASIVYFFKSYVKRKVKKLAQIRA